MEKAKEIQQEQKNIEFESVTIQVPKNIMALLRASSEHGLKMTAKEYLEYSVLETIRADLDAGDVFTVEPEEIISQYNLNPALSILA